MLGTRQTTHPGRRHRGMGAIVLAMATLGALALFPAQGLAANTIEVGVGDASIVVNGTTISTSNLTLEELAKLKGVPPTTVKAELEGLAAETPLAPLVESLVAGLPLETTLASALEQIGNATGGAIDPQTALRQLIDNEEGGPGSEGAAGGGGAQGASGNAGAAGANGNGAAGSGTGKAKAKKRFTLRAAKRSLKGRPGSRVHVRFDVSSAGKLSYSSRKLGKGSRAVKSGANLLTLTLPRKRGTYTLVLQAVSVPDGQRAQTTITLHDAMSETGRRHR